MTNTIDNRVVEMGFDNKQFENGVRTSLNSISNLKKGLNLNESAKSLNNLAEAGRTFSLAGIANGVDNISSKFTAFGAIGFTVLQNLTNSAINFGEKLVKSLMGFDSIKSGLAEYETQMNAVQTIMANTSSKGTTLDEVNAALDELNTYADKTIYNFSEMTRNIGTFTAAGIDLKTSTAAIKGIANLAAVSGSNAQQASTAMYQLSQALSSGTLKLQDWNSVVNAGMGGQVFQDALKDTARIHGVAVDKIIKSEGSFRESLSKGWVTSEILTETLSKFTGDLNAQQLKTMGYTEEQIVAIMKMGTTANDAATKVKTFTQLKDTLMEAMGAGWAKSWQLVIGDFEQAKVFFTEVSDTLGALIGQSADARNALLEGWNKGGGRAALIDALRNSFQGLLGIIKPITTAFRELFPALTWPELKNITVALRDFTAKLKVSSAVADKIKRTFKGVFAVFDIVRMVIMKLVGYFAGLSGSVAPAGNAFLNFTARIGDWLMKVRDGIKYFDLLGKTFEKIRLYIQPFIDQFKAFLAIVGPQFEKLKTTIMGIINTFGQVKSSFSDNFKKIDTSGIDAFFKKINIRFEPLITFGKIIASVFGAVGKILEKTSPIFFKMASAIGDFMGKVGSSLMEGLTTLDFSNLFDTINAGLLGALLLAIRNFMNKGSGSIDKVTGIFDSFKSVLGGVKGVLDGVKGSLEAWQQSLQAKTLLTIAMAIGILTISLIALSMIDSGKLTVALGAVTAMFADLLGSFALYNKSGGGSGGGGFAASIIALSLSLLIMSAAMAKLAKIEPNDLKKGLAAIGALTAGLLLFTKEMSTNSGSILKSSIGLIAFAVALEIIVNVIDRIGKLDPLKLTNGLIGVGVVLAELMAFMNLTNSTKMGIGKGLGLIALAGAIMILSIAVEKFGNMDQTKMIQGLKAIAAVLIELAIFTQLTGDSKKVITTAIGLTILGAAMLIFAEAVKRMGDLSWDQIGKGLATMAGSLAIIIATMQLFPKDMALKAIGLLLIATSLLILSNALTTMGKMSWEEIGKGLAAIAGSLAILAIGMYAMEGTLPGAAALLVAAGALTVFTPVLKTLGSMKPQEIGIALLALAGVFVILGVAGLALTPVVPTLLAIAGVIFLLGIAIAAIGGGILAFAAGLSALAVSGAAGGAAIVTLVTMLLGLIPMIVKSLVGAIILFAQLIIEGAPVIAQALGILLLSLIAVIVAVAPPLLTAFTMLLLQLIATVITVVPAFVDAILYLVGQLLQSLAANVPGFVQSGIDIIMGFLKGIRDNIAQIVTVAIEIVTNFIDAVAAKLPDIIDSGFNLIISFIDGLADSIEKNGPELQAAILKLAKAIVDGLCDGLTSGVSGVVAAIGKLAGAAIDALKTLLGIFSPSRVFAELGENTTQGFVVGMLNYADRVGDAASNLGTQAVSGIGKAVSEISNAIDGNMDMSPTIRPVVDLTDIISSGKQMDQFLGTRTLNLSGTAKNLSIISGGMATPNGENQINQPPVPGAAISLVQNNYSPKALSRLDIYRQTKNQLTILKGLVGTA